MKYLQYLFLAGLLLTAPAAMASNHCDCSNDCQKKCAQGQAKDCACDSCDCKHGTCKHNKCSEKK